MMKQWFSKVTTVYAKDSGPYDMTGKKCVGSVNIFEFSQYAKNKQIFRQVKVCSDMYKIKRKW